MERIIKHVHVSKKSLKHELVEKLEYEANSFNLVRFEELLRGPIKLNAECVCDLLDRLILCDNIDAFIILSNLHSINFESAFFKAVDSHSRGIILYCDKFIKPSSTDVCLILEEKMLGIADLIIKLKCLKKEQVGKIFAEIVHYLRFDKFYDICKYLPYTVFKDALENHYRLDDELNAVILFCISKIKKGRSTIDAIKSIEEGDMRFMMLMEEYGEYGNITDLIFECQDWQKYYVFEMMSR